MAWITKSLVALGFVGAMAVATPTPTVAQGVYLADLGSGLKSVGPATASAIIAAITITLTNAVVGTAGP
jgi:hypothetical protein